MASLESSMVRWLRVAINRLRHRQVCFRCGRHLPEVGDTRRCGMTLLARGHIRPR